MPSAGRDPWVGACHHRGCFAGHRGRGHADDAHTLRLRPIELGVGAGEQLVDAVCGVGPPRRADTGSEARRGAVADAEDYGGVDRGDRSGDALAQCLQVFPVGGRCSDHEFLAVHPPHDVAAPDHGE